MNKKAFFFTSIGIILSVILLLAFQVFDEQHVSKSTDAVEIRVVSVNDFIRDVEQDIQKGIIITTTRTFLALQEYLTEQGVFLNDIETTFQEAFLNGTVDSNALDLLTNSTFPDWVDSIRVEAEGIDVLINFSINDVEIVQSSPWDINISVNVTINATDERDTASWLRTQRIASQVNIVGFEDPVYLVNTLGKVTNIIIVSNFTVFANGQDTTILGIHNNESYYVSHNESPNYLMRMEGNFSASEYGIESLVDIKDLQDQGIPAKVRSAVDYIYWGNTSPVINRINNTPDWFYLDDEHLVKYNVTQAVFP